jgi:hypothetical protein
MQFIQPALAERYTLDIEAIVSLVNSEELYTHILNVEGEKHPIDSLDRMEEAADYILSKFKEYGLSTNEQWFRVDGFDYNFRNIEGILSSGSSPELIIVSHYDTVAKSPGANDNGSGIAVMLECARVLSQANWKGNARFVSFCLEELNPARIIRIREMALKYGIRDSHRRFKTWYNGKMIRTFDKTFRGLFRYGNEIDRAFTTAMNKLKDEFTPSQISYLREYESLFEGITVMNWPGKTALMGSDVWVQKSIKEGKQLLGVICLDTVGYASNEEYSQKFPKEMDPDMFDLYKADKEIRIGNFIAVIGDKNSETITKSFLKQCKCDLIDLPFACLQEAFDYEQCAHFMSDLLRSDHAPFWRENIPGMFLTDSAEFRYPYYHTSADTIDKMDFDFLTKICKAVLGTIVDLATTQ